MPLQIGMIVALLPAFALAGPGTGAVQTNVNAALICAAAKIKPGVPFRIAARFDILPGWHIYWSNPGDGGAPTSIKLLLPPGFTASDIQFPTPIRIEQPGGIVCYGYDNQTLLLATITPPADYHGGPVEINAQINWLVCNDDACIPGAASRRLTFPAAEDDVQPALIEKFVHQLPEEISKSDIAEAKLSLSGLAQEMKLKIELRWKGAAAAKVEYFPPASAAALFGKPMVNSTGQTTTIEVPFSALSGTDDSAVQSVLAYDLPAEGGRVGVALPIDLNLLREQAQR